MAVVGSPGDPLEALSAALGLPFESQDWGIVNADGARLAEFIAFYEKAGQLVGAQRHALGELVVASMNEALDRGHVPRSVVSAFLNFLTRRQGEFPEVTKYWSSLNSDEFPVARLLRPGID